MSVAAFADIDEAELSAVAKLVLVDRSGAAGFDGFVVHINDVHLRSKVDHMSVNPIYDNSACEAD